MDTNKDFGEADAKRIIQRAAQIDEQVRGRVDSDTLRVIAAEAGISPVAIDQALREELAPRVTKRTWIGRHPGLIVTLALFAAFLIMRSVQ